MNERQLRAIEKLRADQAIVSATADRVRGGLLPMPDPERYRQPLGELLDALAEHLPHVDPPVREHAVRVCRNAFGDRMDQPGTRRSRRR
ncbi:hypothetical protein GCM10010472_04070 [Pseudonocardia halophobica]|uniref:Uncharacterized protein n=1 Tax=Pseudonocardia halophobica TaxID=29401 RepID=A0A9W6L473_9PSEU|nr:hypothetical protein [Pseudonocardia halophobica]GLL13366.1 hypothetical protein GCM10017577_45090 [Pseudonocardia halophobica]